MAGTYPQIRLRSGRDASIRNRHPWIFSGALVPPSEDIPNGSMVEVVDQEGNVAATGTYSRHSIIAVRIFEYGPAVINRGWIKQKIANAIDRRKLLGFGSDLSTTAYRVIFGESDGLPGLVVDKYSDILVIQIATAGMDLLRQLVVENLVEAMAPRGILEKSDAPNRHEEGLDIRVELCHGVVPANPEFMENGRKHIIDIASGQKTGFFLDQRDLRQEICRLAKGRRIGLDLFSYTGAAGLAALAGGVEKVHFVDSSGAALDLCRRSAHLNQIDDSRLSFDESDVFQWLSARSTPEYDMVMVDPPALIKSQRHREAGRKAYHFLNRAAMRLVLPGGLLVSSSCSAFMTESEFAVTLRRAADQNGASVELLKIIRQSPDHPLSLYFPEAYYLKSFICRVL